MNMNQSPEIDITALYNELQPFFEKWEKFIEEYGYLHARLNYVYWRSRLVDDYPTHTKHQKENTDKLNNFQAIFDIYLEKKKCMPNAAPAS